MAEQVNTTTPDELSTLVVLLLKGVLYHEGDAGLWNALIQLQARVRDYVGVLGLELMLDEAEGYAFLRSRPESDEDSAKLPRLVARRPLSFPVSLLLALLRKKLAEFDASGGDTRLMLSRDEIMELIRVFLPASSNEARLSDQIETHLNKIVELGFLRRLKSTVAPQAGQVAVYEVRRILKAFVDAQWLAEFDTRLATYQAQLNAAPARAFFCGRGACLVDCHGLRKFWFGHRSLAQKTARTRCRGGRQFSTLWRLVPQTLWH